MDNELRMLCAAREELLHKRGPLLKEVSSAIVGRARAVRIRRQQRNLNREQLKINADAIVARAMELNEERKHAE